MEKFRIDMADVSVYKQHMCAIRTRRASEKRRIGNVLTPVRIRTITLSSLNSIRSPVGREATFSLRKRQIALQRQTAAMSL
jgi:hypothetical protein